MRDENRQFSRNATVEQVMTPDPKTVKADDTVQKAAQIMRDEETGIVPVIDERKHVVGVVTDRDLVTRVVSEGDEPKRVRVADVMTEKVHTARPSDPVSEVVRIMQSQQVRRVPIASEDGTLVGIVSMKDVATEAPVTDSAVGRAVEQISEDRGGKRQN